MKVSELIKELEDMLNEWGDLEVVKGKDYVGSEEVTGVTTIHGNCYIVNEYLDNYTMKNKDKLEWVKKDLKHMLKALSCSDCKNQFDGYCYWNNYSVKNKGLNVKCFEPKDLSYDRKWKIHMMQNCIHKLEHEIKKGNEY